MINNGVFSVNLPESVIMMQIHRFPEYHQAYQVIPGPLSPLITEVVWFNYSEIHVKDEGIYGDAEWKELHHFHQMDVMLDGELTLILEGENGCQTGQAGDAWIIPPLVKHGVMSRHSFRYCSFKFFLASQFWPLFGTQFQRFVAPAYLCALVDAMGKRSSVPSPLISQQAAAAITCCLVELADQHPVRESTDDRLNEFQQLLWPLLEQVQKEPSIKWNVAQMANRMSLSADYFSRCFHRVIGQTPQRYVLEAAMRASAGRLLEVPVHPIKEIAERAGYGNVYAFTRAFTQVFEISPAAYRRQATHESGDA